MTTTKQDHLESAPDPGAARVVVWQPKIRAPGAQKTLSVTVPAQGLTRQTVAVNVRP